jgi:curli biogenesis system outer membrane secretion channel CsgG
MRERVARLHLALENPAMSRSFVIAALIASTLSISSLSAQEMVATASPAPAAEVGIAPTAKRERPRVFVQAFEFNAQLGEEERAELNSFAALVSAARGQDPQAALQQSMANLGRAAADLLVEALLEGGEVRVVERRALDAILAEQNLVASDRAAEGQDVARTARVAGARYMVTGSITKFGQSRQQSRVAAIAGGILRAKTGIGGVSSGKTVYTIGITARLVDTETGDIIASVKTDGIVEGNKHRTIAAGGVLGGVLGGAMSNGASNERELRIGEALVESTGAIAEELVAKLLRELAND